MNYILNSSNIPTKEQECGAEYQTFCNINGQTVKDNITFIYNSPVIAQETYNLAEIWNEIQAAIKVIHNLGVAGTRKPDIDGLTDKEKNTYTTLAYYNDLLTRLGKDNKTGLEYIKALDISNLKKIIDNYKLKDDLCALCNNSCQYCNTCQGDCDGCETEDPCNYLCCQVGCWHNNCAGYMCSVY